MPRRLGLALSLTAILSLIVTGFVALELHGLPQSINRNIDASSIHFATDRSWRLTADSCFTVNWQLEHINAVYLNGDAVAGSGEASFCEIDSVRLTVDLIDGRSEDFVFLARPFFASHAGWLSLLFVTIVAYTILLLLRLVPSPLTIFQDLRQSFQASRAAILHGVQTEKGSHLFFLLTILLCGLLLRLLYLDKPIRYDEASSLHDYVLVDNIFDSLSRYERPNNHLLNTLLMYLSIRSFARLDEWALRVPNLFAGLVSILLTYVVARQHFTRQTALLSSGLVAVSSAMITYSVMARGYMLQILFFLALVCLSQYLAKTRSHTAWLVFIICGALGFYSVLTMLYGFVAIAVYLFITFLHDDRTRLWEWLIGLVCTGWLSLLLYIPVLGRFGLAAIVANKYTTALSWGDYFAQLPHVLATTLAFWLEGIPGIIAGLLLFGLLTAASFNLYIRWTTRSKPQCEAFAILPIVILITFLIVTVQHPSLYAAPHIFLFILPLLAIASASGLMILFEKLRYSQLLILIFTLTLALGVHLNRSPYLSYEGGVYHDAEAVTAYLAQIDTLNFRLALSPHYYEPLRYYFLEYSIPVEQIARDYQTVDTIFFIVRDRFDPSVRAVMNELIGQRARGFSEPEIVASFEFSDLYRMDRRE